MLEKMGEFFDRRLDTYDEHQLNCIQFAPEFYRFTAQNLPMTNDCCVLDLGCGTGLELEEYFKLNPSAQVTGVDLAPGMLAKLKSKFPDKKLILLQSDYFKINFGKNLYDAILSVESLHHFTMNQKIPLYKKLHDALKENGYFILTDYFAPSLEDEKFYQQELIRLKALQGISDDEFYHYDTPLTIGHETEALLEAGFSSVKELNSWTDTHTIKAVR